MICRIAKKIATTIVLITAMTTADAAEPVQVMIVGTFHMDNPGHDLHNMKIDDVLVDKRQKELADITAHLLRFRPTTVMVESQRRDPDAATLPRYREYLAGSLAASRNEIVQVGFRLAKAAGLKEVYGIDVDGDFPYEAVQAFADAHGKGAILTELGAQTDASLAQASALLARSTLGATLRYFNRPEQIARGHDFYASMLQIGAGDEQPGADLAAAWSKRNIEICARLIQTTHPGDHAVVLYGSGHAFLLRQCIRQTPGFILVEPDRYLP